MQTIAATLPAPTHHLDATERRAAGSLAAVFALRMLGLFLVLPVFALEAHKYSGGDNPAVVGLAMGLYGLTQGLLQIPYGIASDRFGRKRVIVLGLIIFALGSFWAAAATDMTELLMGRALQGAGAISAAVTALLADLTRPTVRTKAMALVGASIGLMFAISLVAAPALVGLVGLGGLFAGTGILAICGIGLIVWVTPPAPRVEHARRTGFLAVLKHPALWRLNVGVFALHAAQLAMWVAVPSLLVSAGLPKTAHWQVYLPAVFAAFALTGGVFAAERRGHLKTLMLAAIMLLIAVQLGFALLPTNMWVLGGLLFVFFLGFNALEATQPSLVTRFAPAAQRGAALGVFNTLQSLGFFVGGALGGLISKNFGFTAIFMTCAALLCVWLASAKGMPTLSPNNPSPIEKLSWPV
jgi:MFS family permease